MHFLTLKCNCFHVYNEIFKSHKFENKLTVSLCKNVVDRVVPYSQHVILHFIASKQ